MLRLAAGLARSGLQVDLLVHTLAGAELAVPAPLKVVQLGSSGSLGSVLRLAAWLRVQRPRWLLSAFPHTNVAAVAAVVRAGGGSRCVLSEHAPLSHQIRRQSQGPGAWRWRLLPPLVRWAYHRADAVVAVSQGVHDDLQRLLRPGARLHTIHNPVLDAQAMTPLPLSAAPLHPWLLDRSLQVVLSVSRLSEEKDIPTLLLAFAALHRQRPHTRLLLVGEGPARAGLQAQVKELQLQAVVALPGRVQAPSAWMQAAAVFALASTYEGFGNVLVEALAVGTAVVSTDCPVGPREILAGGRHGHLVPVGDWQAMAQALTAAVDAPGASAAAVAHAWRYTDAAACSAYRQLLDSLPALSVPASPAARG